MRLLSKYLPTFFKDKPTDEESKGLAVEALLASLGLPANAERDGQVYPEHDRISPRLVSEYYERSPAVRTCADKIAAQTLQAPLRCYYKKTAAADEKVDTESVVALALEFINPRMTRAEYMTRIVRSLAIYDRAYAAIEVNPHYKEKDHPHEDYAFFLYPMNPAFVEVVVDSEGDNWYVYSPNGIRGVPGKYDKVKRSALYRADEVISMDAGFAPKDDFRGQSKLNAAQYDLEQERVQRAYVTQQLKSEINIRGVITANSAGNEDGGERIRRQIERRHVGQDKTDRILLLEEGWKYEDIKRDTFSLQTQAVNDGATKSVFWLFGVPTGIITGDAANLDELQELFWENTIWYYTTIVEQAHDKYFCKAVKGRKYRIGFDYTPVKALRRRYLDMVRAAVALAGSGLATVNEARRNLEMPDWTPDVANLGDPENWPDGCIPLMLANIAAISSGHIQGQKQGAEGNDRGNAGSVGAISPSLTLPGMGGRDQSAGGEAQMVDTSGKKAIESVTEDEIAKFIKRCLPDYDED